jgi:hypothetical protein
MARQSVTLLSPAGRRLAQIRHLGNARSRGPHAAFAGPTPRAVLLGLVSALSPTQQGL